MTNGPPTQAAFLAFVRNVMGINSTILPDDSPVTPMAFCVAIEIVNIAISYASCLIYSLAVYNLAGSNLLNYAQDQPGAPPLEGTSPPMAFFAATRARWNISGFVSGVIQSASDQGTSDSFVVQEAAKNFTLANLQQLKDPYGRQYLAFAQSYGTLWGLT